MNNDDAIIQLLTEIRDNQILQMEANKKTQQDHIAHYNAAVERQQRSASKFAALFAVGVGLLIVLFMLK